MSDPSEFKLEFDASEAAAAARAASDVERLADSLDHVASASAKTRAKTLIGGFGGISSDAKASKAALEKATGYGIGQRRPTQIFSAQAFANLQNHANAVVKLRKSYTALAPASRSAALGLKMLGVHGAGLRKVSIDAAKSEIALRRLYRMKGGGLRGALGVAGSISERFNVPQRAGSALISGAGSVAKGALGVAGSAATIGGGAAVVGASLLGFNMAETAIEAQRVKFALDSITKGQGDQWWATSAEYAKRFGLNVNTVAENLMNMKASGFSDEMAKTLFLRMGDLRSLGATEDTISRALLAIRQVEAAGKLQGDELNQLSEAGINANFVYAELSKTLGKTVPQIIKMKEAGQLSSDIVIPAIANAIGAKTGGKAAGVAGENAATKTVIGQWGRLKGAFSVASTEAIGSDALLPLQKAISSFTAWLSGDGGQKAIGAFGSVLTRMFEAAPNIINGVIWLLDTGIPAAWNAFSTSFTTSGGGEAIDSMLTGFSNIAGDNGQSAERSLRSIGSAAGQLAGSLVTLTGYLVTAVGWLEKLGGVWNVVDKAMWLTPLASIKAVQAGVGWLSSSGEGDKSSATPIPGSSAASAQATTDGIGIGLSLADGMRQGMTYGAPGVADAAAMLGNVANTSVRETEGIHSPGRRMAELGGYESEGFALGMARSAPLVYQASSSIGDTATAGVSDATQARPYSRTMARIGEANGSGYSYGFSDSARRFESSVGSTSNASRMGFVESSSTAPGVGVSIVSTGPSTVTRSPMFSGSPSLSSGFAPAIPSASGPSILPPVSQTANSGASVLSKPAPWAATGAPVLPAGQPAIAPVVSGSASQMSAAMGGASETVATGVSGSAAAISASAAQVAPSTAQPAGGTATIQVQVDVHVTGGTDAAHQGQQIGASAARALEPELAQLLRRFNYSGV